MIVKSFVTAFALLFLLLTPLYCLQAEASLPAVSLRTADKFFRTELYFGMDRKGGGEVTLEQWTKFLSEEVTPRFPDGLTVFDAAGQFRSASGTIVKERSRVIVLLFRREGRSTASRKIDEIRAAYCKQFDQESVMRLDFRKSVEVSFE